MPELRWTLLILGILFLAVLAWREVRKQRRFPAPPPDEPAQPRFREPILSLPEIRPREPAPELPVVQIEDDSMIGLRVDGVRIEEDIQTSEAETDVEPEIIDEPVEETEAPAPSTASPLEPELLPEPIVEWPAEDQRKLLSIRLVPHSGARFSGRALRLALMAEGFRLGKFSIFHKPGPDGRVIVSAASLTQPGTFDLGTIDTQSFGGLGLFSVLPGPMSDLQTFDELLATARVLNERLQGALQDERGEPLTPLRAASLRERIEAQAPPPESAPESP